MSTNFSFDIQGVPDTRPGTIGSAGSQLGNITFKPPAGYVVNILRVYGDFAIVPMPNAQTGMSGTLFGLETTAVAASKYADLGADDCFLYIQLFTKGEPERAAYDNAVQGIQLASDNILQLKAAVFYNTFNAPVHMEPSLIIVYQFVKSGSVAAKKK